jgi:hypothetical protein
MQLILILGIIVAIAAVVFALQNNLPALAILPKHIRRVQVSGRRPGSRPK